MKEGAVVTFFLIFATLPHLPVLGISVKTSDIWTGHVLVWILLEICMAL